FERGGVHLDATQLGFQPLQQELLKLFLHVHTPLGSPNRAQQVECSKHASRFSSAIGELSVRAIGPLCKRPEKFSGCSALAHELLQNLSSNLEALQSRRVIVGMTGHDQFVDLRAFEETFDESLHVLARADG